MITVNEAKELYAKASIRKIAQNTLKMKEICEYISKKIERNALKGYKSFTWASAFDKQTTERVIRNFKYTGFDVEHSDNFPNLYTITFCFLI